MRMPFSIVLMMAWLPTCCASLSEALEAIVALQGLVVLEHLKNIRSFQRLVFFAGALEGFRAYRRRKIPAQTIRVADTGNDQHDGADRAEEVLIKGAAALGQDGRCRSAMLMPMGTA